MLTTAARLVALIAATGAAARWARGAESRTRIRAASRVPSPRSRMSPLVTRVEEALDDAGIAVSPSDAFRIWLAGAVGVTALVFAVAPLFAVLAGAACLGAIPVGFAWARARHERT